MTNKLLKGKKGLIFGALNENSIAWKVAERAVEEGAEIVLTNTAASIRMGTINTLADPMVFLASECRCVNRDKIPFLIFSPFRSREKFMVQKIVEVAKYFHIGVKVDTAFVVACVEAAIVGHERPFPFLVSLFDERHCIDIEVILVPFLNFVVGHYLAP